jgi:hypothetical protein
MAWEQLYDLKPEVIWQNYPFSAEMYRNLCFMEVIFLGATLNKDENLYTLIWLCKLYYASFSFWFKGGAQEIYLYKDTEFCRLQLKMDYFAIPVPVSSHIVTLELFPT